MVGKEVLFNIEYKAGTGREFVTLFLGACAAAWHVCVCVCDRHAGPAKENVTAALLGEGWVRLREGSRAGEYAEPYAVLAAAAEAAKRGVFALPTAEVTALRCSLRIIVAGGAQCGVGG